jgi:hypothetical protein
MRKVLLVAAAIFLWIFFGPKFCSDKPEANSGSANSRVDACVARGIAYFKDVGSFPYLSTGRDAVEVAIERCRRTTTAFDLG